MSQRYGGRYSPGAQREAAATDWHAKRPSRVGARSNLLFLVPVPFAFQGFFGAPGVLALKLSAFGILMLAAWLTREGLRAEEAYDARRVARRPAIPRKIFGSVLMGLGLGLGGYSAAAGLGGALVFAVSGAALHFLAFGPDPLKDKGEGVETMQADRVIRALADAEGHLTEMTAAIRRLNDRALADRMAAFQQNVRAMFRVVADDPRNLTIARRYLGVYLLGARDATLKFVELYGRRRDPAARADYEALLNDLDRNFTARTQALVQNDRTALEIEIEVLRDRLAREGVRPETDAPALPDAGGSGLVRGAAVNASGNRD